MKLHLRIRPEFVGLARQFLQMFRKVLNGKSSIFVVINQNGVNFFTDCQDMALIDERLPVCLILSSKFFEYVQFSTRQAQHVIALELKDVDLFKKLFQIASEEHHIKLSKEHDFRFFKLTLESPISSSNCRFQVEMADLAVNCLRLNRFIGDKKVIAELKVPGEQCHLLFRSASDGILRMHLSISKEDSTFRITINKPKTEFTFTRCKGEIRGEVDQGQRLEMNVKVHYNYWERLKQLFSSQNEVLLLVQENGMIEVRIEEAHAWVIGLMKPTDLHWEFD